VPITITAVSPIGTGASSVISIEMAVISAVSSMNT
jgi:hypothetical protein